MFVAKKDLDAFVKSIEDLINSFANYNIKVINTLKEDNKTLREHIDYLGQKQKNMESQYSKNMIQLQGHYEQTMAKINELNKNMTNLLHSVI